MLSVKFVISWVSPWYFNSWTLILCQIVHFCFVPCWWPQNKIFTITQHLEQPVGRASPPLLPRAEQSNKGIGELQQVIEQEGGSNHHTPGGWMSPRWRGAMEQFQPHMVQQVRHFEFMRGQMASLRSGMWLTWEGEGDNNTKTPGQCFFKLCLKSKTKQTKKTQKTWRSGSLPAICCEMSQNNEIKSQLQAEMERWAGRWDTKSTHREMASSWWPRASICRPVLQLFRVWKFSKYNVRAKDTEEKSQENVGTEEERKGGGGVGKPEVGRKPARARGSRSRRSQAHGACKTGGSLCGANARSLCHKRSGPALRSKTYFPSRSGCPRQWTGVFTSRNVATLVKERGLRVAGRNETAMTTARPAHPASFQSSSLFTGHTDGAPYNFFVFF